MSQQPRIARLPDGRRLAYDEYGPTNGLPVFYFHGAPSARVEPQIFGLPELAPRLGIRLIVPDRPGAGLSDFLPRRRVSDWPADVAALADHLGIDRFAVLGYSGGGPYALATALRIPERLLAVTTVSGAGPFDVPGLAAGVNPNSWSFMKLSVERPRLHGMACLLMGLTARFAPGQLTSQAVAALPEPDARFMSQPGAGEAFAHMVREATRQGVRGATLDTALMVRPWDFDPREIRIPVRMWHGEADANAPVAMGHYLAERIPQVNATFVHGEGHLSVLANNAETILGELKSTAAEMQRQASASTPSSE